MFVLLSSIIAYHVLLLILILLIRRNELQQVEKFYKERIENLTNHIKQLEHRV